MGRLVLITGPIASGKSTVAAALAARMADAGRSAAAVDLDDVVESMRAPLDRFKESWMIARRVHGQLVASWLSANVDVVIAHGPIFTGEDERLLLHDVADVTPFRVLLRVPFAVAVERVSADPSRAVSKDLAFLRSTYDAFEASTPTLGAFEWDIDTSVVTVPETVERVLRDLL